MTPIVRTTLQVMAATVGIVSGVAALTTEGDLLRALYAVGRVMVFLSIPALISYGVWQWKQNPGWTAGLFIGAGVGALIAAIEDDDLGIAGSPDTFGWWQATGAAFILEALVIGVLFAHTGYQRRHKQCPDCISMVPAAAKVCRYCGFRFPPESARP